MEWKRKELIDERGRGADGCRVEGRIEYLQPEISWEWLSVSGSLRILISGKGNQRDKGKRTDTRLLQRKHHAHCLSPIVPIIAKHCPR